MIYQNIPLISVLICTYNAEKFIKETLLSVFNQTYKHIEVLVLDNNSEDSTVQIIESFVEKDDRIKLFTGNENLGAYKGLNYLIKRAKGKYIAIQDHDDIWHPRKLALQVDFLEEHTEYIGCGGKAIYLYENISKIKFSKVKAINNFSPHPSLVFRNQGFYYDTSILYKTDAYFMKYILCNQKKVLYNIQKFLFVHRFRADGNNLTKKLLKIDNILTYFNKTKDYKTLFIGLLRYSIPFAVLNFIGNYISIEDKVRKIDYLNQDDFTKEYLRYLKNGNL